MAGKADYRSTRFQLRNRLPPQTCRTGGSSGKPPLPPADNFRARAARAFGVSGALLHGVFSKEQGAVRVFVLPTK